MWTKERDNAFLNLKKFLVTAPIHGYPDQNTTFILDTDASGCQWKLQDGKERVIFYGSKVLSKD